MVASNTNCKTLVYTITSAANDQREDLPFNISKLKNILVLDCWFGQHKTFKCPSQYVHLM